MNKFKFAMSQRGRPSERNKAFAILLDVADLPGNDWTTTSEKSWRSGSLATDQRSEVAKRSLKTGGFVAWRSFRQTSTGRGFWVQVGPYGREEDATAAVPNLFASALANQNFKGTETEVREASVQIRGVSNAYAEERNSTGSPHGPSNTKYVSGSVYNFVFAFACYEYGTGWPWDEVALFAQIQSEKVRDQLPENLPDTNR